MITPAYALTATERVLPRMALDFTTGTLDPRVSVARALNTATRVNSSGLLEMVNADLPRFDYNPATLAPRGLLIEETRTNIMPTSNVFTGWANNGASVSASTEISPDGTTNATLMTGVSGNFRITRILSGLATGVPYSFSWFAKAGTSNTIKIAFINVLDGPVFNFSTGTWGPPGSWTLGAQAFPNGWWRLTATLVGTAASSGPGLSVSGVGATAHIYEFQVEQAAFPTSTIPNSGATTTTRNADVATMTGTNFSDWWTATTGAAVIRALPSTVSGTRPLIQFDDTTANEIIALRGNTTNPELYIVDGGTPQAQIDAGTIAENTAYNLAAAWNTDNCAASINGASAVTDVTATMPTVTQARLGSDGTNYLNGCLQTFRYWPQRLINAEVQAFSK